jgi:ankyrin repeat protein
MLLAGLLVLAAAWVLYIGPKADKRLHQAVEEGDVLMARLMCVAVIDQDLMVYSPLSRAAKLGNVEMGRVLLQMGANIDRGGKADDPPLWTAASHGQVDFMRMLIANGADLSRGLPLMRATQGCHVEAVKLLLSPELRPRITEHQLTTARQVAEATGCHDVLRLLPPDPTRSSTQTP